MTVGGIHGTNQPLPCCNPDRPTLQDTGVFPRALLKFSRESKLSWLVAEVATTSTSLIIGTGLKKWRPPKRSSLEVELAMSVMGREEVLLAKMVCLVQGRRCTALGCVFFNFFYFFKLYWTDFT